MSRFSADSDMDYADEPWNRPEPCQTRGCENACDIPASSAYCYYCRCKALDDCAKANEEHKRRIAAAPSIFQERRSGRDRRETRLGREMKETA